jgi:predicted CXXCH cytochrome family protein
MTVRMIGQSVMLAAIASGSVAFGQAQRDYTKRCSSAGCHDAYAGKAVVHGPVATDTCDACHEAASGEKHRFDFTEEGADLCLDCHDELVEDLAFLHGPVAAGACTACHNPHASDHPAMLFAQGPNLCMKCHDAMRTRMTQKKHVHAPAKEECTSCHDPHGAGNSMMLTASPPELCIECHDTIEELMEDSAVTHNALTSGKSCAACHQPHASDVEHVLLMEQMDLCLSCHNKPLKSGRGQVLNMAQLLLDNPNHHGPVAQKDCTSCHQAHGGENFRMLVEGFPAGFYAPFDEDRYALCFSCHEPELALDEETDTLTNFRNGKENLHYRHVNRKVKGRTCRACHNVHASRREKFITETVPFGEWRLPLNYQQTSTGGSCQPGCHREYRYDREKPVVNVPKS